MGITSLNTSQDFESTYLDTYLPITGRTITGVLQVSGGIDSQGVITSLNAKGAVTTNLCVLAQNIALGSGSSATGSASLALMKNSTSSAANAIAIGQSATASHN